MQTFNIGKYKVVLKEHDNNKTDNSMYETVIDFGYEDNKTIVVQVLCGTESRNVAFLVPLYMPVEHFAVPSDNKIFMMFNDILCVFNPETCKIEQEKELETMGTMFLAFAYEKDFILYGEVEIYRVDKNLNVLWEFSGKDVFVKKSGGEPAFQMKDDRICLYDFSDNYYEIDYEGNILMEIQL